MALVCFTHTCFTFQESLLVVGFCLPFFFLVHIDLGEGNSIVSIFSQQVTWPPSPCLQASESCNQIKSSEQDGKLQGSFCPMGKKGLSGPKGGAVDLEPPQGIEKACGIKGWFPES